MTNIDALIAPKREMILGGEKFELEEMPAGKALKIVDEYNDIILSVTKKGVGELLNNSKVSSRYLNLVVGICVKILQIPFSFHSFKKWIKRKKITKKYLLNNFSSAQLQGFIQEVLKPILGEDAKKKVAEVQKILGVSTKL